MRESFTPSGRGDDRNAKQLVCGSVQSSPRLARSVSTMRDFTAPISPQLAAALQRVWKPPTVASCQRIWRDTARTQAQLDDWEHEGGMIAPRIQTED